VVNKKRQTEISLLLPLYAGGSVEGLIANGKGFPHCPFATGHAVMNVIRGTIAGLRALHAAGYRHNDMKPANILLQQQEWRENDTSSGSGSSIGQERTTWHAVLTDFGSTCPLVVEVNCRAQALDVQDFHASHSTASIRAPEVFDPPSNGLVVDGRADVWGLGATLFAILFSRTPFESPREGFSSLAAMSGSYVVPPGHPWGQPFEALLAMCLTPAPTERATLDAVDAAVTALPSAPVSLVHVFPPEPEKKPMPMWHPGDTAAQSLNNGSTAGSPARPAKQAAAAAAVDWGDASFEVDFSQADIPPVVPAAAVGGDPAADTSGGVAAADSAASAEFDATFAFADADGEEEDKEDFEDFGDFTSAPQRRRSSSSNAGSLRLSAGQATRALGAASPVNLSPTSESTSTSPRTLRGNRTRLESGFSSDGEGEGRPSDVDEFGDNDRFSSYAEGRLSLTKIQIATKANGNGNVNENDKCFDSSSSETAEANLRMPGREREAAPTRLSGSGAEGGDDFGAFEG